MSDWKEIVRTIAPGLATILSGPLAGAAVSALSTAVLGKEGGSQDELAAVISGASPDVLARIKEADAKLKADLANAGVKLEEIAASDRASARQREVQLQDPTTRWLAIIYTLIYFTALWAVWRYEVPPSMNDTLNLLLGALTAAQAAIMNYYFGSSAGSAHKDILLSKALE